MRRLPLFVFCLAVAAVSGCSAAARSQQANRSPSTTTTTTTTTTTATSTTGSNACTGTPGHEPVVLLYGTFGLTSWGAIDTALSAGGYCLYPFDYGNGGTGEIGQSAGALAKFVDDVLARTGAKRVSIIGHSQGGLMARYYVKFLGGDKYVYDLLRLSPPDHRTPIPMAVQGGVAG